RPAARRTPGPRAVRPGPAAGGRPRTPARPARPRGRARDGPARPAPPARPPAPPAAPFRASPGGSGAWRVLNHAGVVIEITKWPLPILWAPARSRTWAWRG